MRPSLEELTRLACQAEVLARKPGNVHPGAAFDDLSAADFLTAAEAVAPILANAPNLGIGRAVHDAVAATRQRIATNANLGICLLLAPLSAAADRCGNLRETIPSILDQLTVDDARWAYAAIRLATPGGLGQAPQQDVSEQPTVTLLEAMRMAADRDAVARQYATGFEDVFSIGLPAIRRFRDDGIETAIIAAHLSLMAKQPDTLILRKCGRNIADESASRASLVLQRGWPAEPGRAEERKLDEWLRADGHRRNPGATADLVAATLFVAIEQNVLDLHTITRWRDDTLRHSR
jgi:triphosphoribosyl-dephospho-CoA synthase